MKPLKALMVGIIGLLAVGCASTPTMKSVAGTYEADVDGETSVGVFLENGDFEVYNGEKLAEKAKWKLVGKEIHVFGSTHVGVGIINKDGSLTWIANIDKNGNRKDLQKEEQESYKKIK